MASLVLLLAGCGEQLGPAQSADRLTALRACTKTALAQRPRDSSEVVARLRRVESCMAMRDLPGNAGFDPVAGTVTFAYEAEVPHLHF